MELKMEAEELNSVLEAGKRYQDEALLNLSNDGVLMRIQEPSGTSLYSSYIPEKAMEKWEPGSEPRIGMHLSKITDFIPSSSEIVTLRLVEGAGRVYKFKLTVGSRTYTIGVIEPDSVSGVPNQVPDLNPSVSAKMDWKRVEGFISDYETLRGETKQGSVTLSVRDDKFCMWGEYDDNNVFDSIPLNDFPSFELDWSGVNKAEGANLPWDPQEDRMLESIYSVGFLRLISPLDDEVTVKFDNAFPLKVITESDNGVKQSWMVPPRIPGGDDKVSIPEKVINQGTV